MHQAAIQTRGFTAAQNLRQQLQAIQIRRAVLRHVPQTINARLRHRIGHFAMGIGGMCGHIHRRLRHARASRNVTKELRYFFLGGGQINIAGQHQHRVIRAIPSLEPGLHVLQRSRVEVVHRANGAVVVRMPGRIHDLAQLIPDLAVRLVFALALLVLHHTALLVQGLLVDCAQQVAHAVRFHPQRHIQRGGGHVFEIIGAVGIGGAVLVGGAHFLERGEEFARRVFAAVEHQVLEQMRKAGAAGRFVLAADVIPHVDRHDGGFAIGMHHHPQAIGEGEAFVRNIHRRRIGGLYSGGIGTGRQRGGKRKRQRGGTKHGHRQLL